MVPRGVPGHFVKQKHWLYTENCPEHPDTPGHHLAEEEFKIIKKTTFALYTKWPGTPRDTPGHTFGVGRRPVTISLAER